MANPKKKKLTKLGLRRRGQISYYHVLMRAGETEKAEAWAARHKLYAIPPNDPTATLSPAPKAASPTASATDSSKPTLSAAPSLAAPASPVGGAGVQVSSAGQNLDQSGPRGSFSQLATGGSGGHGASSTLGNAADAALTASPSGEVEGNKQSCQGDKGGLFSNRLENEGWVVSGEGVVGGNCRNRWFVEVQVGGQWAKAAVGDVPVRNGQRVRVRLEWVSADGRDAEYAIVEVMPDKEEPKQAKPVGFAQQNARNVPIAKETAQEAKPQAHVFQTLPPQSLGFQQLPVPVIHDQPKEIVFQTTTMEQIVAKERVGVMHASGKSGIIPTDASFKSPVLDDVPVKSEPEPAAPAIADDSDFMDRARAAAFRELMGNA